MYGLFYEKNCETAKMFGMWKKDYTFPRYGCIILADYQNDGQVYP